MTQRALQSLRWCAAHFALLSLLASASVMRSQTQLPTGAGDARVGLESGLPPSLLKNGSLGELLSIYTPRDRDEIQRQLNLARSDQESAVKDIAETRRVADAADGRVQIMNEELKTTKTRISVAKKEKNSSDRATLDVELKRQETELKYFERVRDVSKADTALLDSKSTSASARVKALELETDVARKYDAIVDVRTDSTPDVSGYRDVLKRMLTAREDAADREVDAASKEKAVATRRLKQLDALSKLNN